MKRIALTIILLFANLTIFAQQHPETFSVRDGDIIWQKVYDSSLDSSAVATTLQGNAHLSDFENTPLGLACKVNLGRLDYQGAGFRYIQTVALVTSTQAAGQALLQFREGRYRVTVSMIVFNSDIQALPTVTLADFLGNKNSIQNVFFSKNTAAILDYNLNRLFLIVETENDEW